MSRKSARQLWFVAQNQAGNCNAIYEYNMKKNRHPLMAKKTSRSDWWFFPKTKINVRATWPFSTTCSRWHDARLTRTMRLHFSVFRNLEEQANRRMSNARTKFHATSKMHSEKHSMMKKTGFAALEDIWNGKLLEPRLELLKRILQDRYSTS